MDVAVMTSPELTAVVGVKVNERLPLRLVFTVVSPRKVLPSAVLLLGLEKN